MVPFVPNAAQKAFWKERHTKNLILKARQLGFSTIIDIDRLDSALFSSYKNFGIIAHDLDAANSIFREKIKFAFDNIPEWLKKRFQVSTDRAGQLSIASNGCNLSVDTSFR